MIYAEVLSFALVYKTSGYYNSLREIPRFYWSVIYKVDSTIQGLNNRPGHENCLQSPVCGDGTNV